MQTAPPPVLCSPMTPEALHCLLLILGGPQDPGGKEEIRPCPPTAPLPPTGHMNWGKSPVPSGPQFSICKMGGVSCFLGLCYKASSPPAPLPPSPPRTPAC